MINPKHERLTNLPKFPNPRSYSIFQVPQQQEEPIDIEKSMKFIIQSQNDYI